MTHSTFTLQSEDGRKVDVIRKDAIVRVHRDVKRASAVVTLVSGSEIDTGLQFDPFLRWWRDELDEGETVPPIEVEAKDRGPKVLVPGGGNA